MHWTAGFRLCYTFAVAGPPPVMSIVRPLDAMTKIESKVVAAWKEASVDLGFQFTSPIVVTLPDGSRQEYLGLVHHFGRRVGTLISVLYEPSERFDHSTNDDYYWSILGPGYGQYKRDDFIETLNDWGYFGPVDRRPDWYAPAAHWGANGPMGV